MAESTPRPSPVPSRRRKVVAADLPESAPDVEAAAAPPPKRSRARKAPVADAGEDLRAVIAGLQAELATLRDATAAPSPTPPAQADLDLARAQLTEATTELDRVRAERAERDQAAQARDAENARLRGELAAATDELARTRGELQAQTEQLTRARRTLDERQADLARLSADVKRLEQELETRDLAPAPAPSSTGRQTLAALRGELTQALVELRIRVRGLEHYAGSAIVPSPERVSGVARAADLQITRLEALVRGIDGEENRTSGAA